jgi:hypothetical protein
MSHKSTLKRLDIPELPSYNYPYNCLVRRPAIKAPPRSLFYLIKIQQKKRKAYGFIKEKAQWQK